MIINYNKEVIINHLRVLNCPKLVDITADAKTKIKNDSQSKLGQVYDTKVLNNWYSNDLKIILLEEYENNNIKFGIGFKGNEQMGIGNYYVHNNINIILDIKKNDIVKIRGNYMVVKEFKINYNQSHVCLIATDMITDLQKEIRLRLVNRKVYTLSDRIKNKITKQKTDYIESQKTFKTDLKKLFEDRAKKIVESNSFQNNTFVLGGINNRYKREFKK